MLGVAAGMALARRIGPARESPAGQHPPRALCRTRFGRKWRGSGVARPLRYCELSSPPSLVSDAVRRPPFPFRFSPAGTLLVCSLHVSASRRIGPTRVACLSPFSGRPFPRLFPEPRLSQRRYGRFCSVSVHLTADEISATGSRRRFVRRLSHRCFAYARRPRKPVRPPGTVRAWIRGRLHFPFYRCARLAAPATAPLKKG